MSKIQNIWHNLKRLTSLPQQDGYQGGFSNLANFLNPGSRIDFAAEVGDLPNVALCQSAIGWVARNLYDARLRTVEIDGDNKETEVKPSELANLFYAPNDEYSGQALIAGIALDWITRSEAYLIKVRGGYNNVAQLWWEPHQTIRPRWTKEQSYYEIWRNGSWLRIETEDVIPIRNGYNTFTRRALINPTTSLLTEFYTEKRAAYFMNLLLRSGLVPPVVVTLGDKDRPFDDTEKHKEIKNEIRRKMSGDMSGEPFVTNDAVNVQRLGYDYSSVGLKEVRQIPISRFCMAMGISPISLHADAGDSTHANYNNVQGYLKQDYRGYVVPLHNLIASALDTHLLPEFGDTENRKVSWDYSQTALMQPDQLLRARTTTLIWEKNIIDRAEAREGVGYKMRPDDIDVYYSDTQPTKEAPQPDPLDDMAEQTAQKVLKAMGMSKKDLDAAADFWREHPALDDDAKGLIDATEYVNGKPS